MIYKTLQITDNLLFNHSRQIQALAACPFVDQRFPEEQIAVVNKSKVIKCIVIDVKWTTI